MSALKERHRQIRHMQSDALATRLHRAISWLTRSEAFSDDADTRFIHLWIAFNAAYAGEFNEGSEHARSSHFVSRLVAVDTENLIHQILLSKFSGSVRLLVDNKYLYAPFWAAMRNHDASDAWKARFKRSKKDAMDAVLCGNAAALMVVVLDRLHLLRNQLIHGGSTWNGSVNRSQVREAAELIAHLVPAVIGLMMDSDAFDDDAIDWPVVPDLPVAG